MTEAQNVEAPEVADAPEGQAVPESIGLQDLQLLAQIVDLASQRGAFRGNELTQVGVVFDKLSAFLNHVAAEQQAKAEAESDEGDAPAEEPAEAPAE
jgi:hypothetical protein